MENPQGKLGIYTIWGRLQSSNTLKSSLEFWQTGRNYIHIVIPTEGRIRRLSSEFECNTGIPNVCGAIGGTHIKLQLKPRNSYRPADYWCSHGFYSILLQGVCDADKVFWDVCCNAPGGLDNSTHLRASSIWARLKDGEILQKPEIHTPNGVCRPVIIGNRSYPFMPFLVVPFNKN